MPKERRSYSKSFKAQVIAECAQSDTTFFAAGSAAICGLNTVILSFLWSFYPCYHMFAVKPAHRHTLNGMYRQSTMIDMIISVRKNGVGRLDGLAYVQRQRAAEVAALNAPDRRTEIWKSQTLMLR